MCTGNYGAVRERIMTEKPAQFRFAREKPGLPGDETWAITHDSISEPTACEVFYKGALCVRRPRYEGLDHQRQELYRCRATGRCHARNSASPRSRPPPTRILRWATSVPVFTGIQTHATVTPVMLRKIDPKVAPFVAISGWARYDRFHRLFRLAGHWATKGRRHRRGCHQRQERLATEWRKSPN